MNTLEKLAACDCENCEHEKYSACKKDSKKNLTGVQMLKKAAEPDFMTTINRRDLMHNIMGAKALGRKKIHTDLSMAVEQARSRGLVPTGYKARMPALGPLLNYVQTIDKAQERNAMARGAGAGAGGVGGVIGGLALGKMIAGKRPKMGGKGALMSGLAIALGAAGAAGGSKAGGALAVHKSKKEIKSAIAGLDPGRIMLNVRPIENKKS